LPDQRTLRFTPNRDGGYDVILTPLHFETDLGANLHLPDWRQGEAQEGKEHAASLSFIFPYYGKIYDRLYVSDDGSIALGHELAAYFSYALHYGGSTPMLLPLLLDLNPGAAGGDVFVRQEAERLIITWQRVPGFYRREDVYTFQAVLYCGFDLPPPSPSPLSAPLVPQVWGERGAGEVAQGVRGEGHFGLSMMAERARSVGGSVKVTSAPGQGTRVTVRMPLAAAAGAGVKGLRVLLADDHPLFLDGLRNMLTAHGMNVVGLARDGIEATEQAVAVRPDLVLLDIQMPRCDGLEAARRIKAALPAATIVMLTVAASEESLFAALKLGASGYILKSTSSEHFFDTLASLLRGEPIFSPEVAARILADFAPAARTPGRGGVTPPLPGLTECQTAVLRLVAQGLTYKEVGPACTSRRSRSNTTWARS